MLAKNDISQLTDEELHNIHVLVNAEMELRKKQKARFVKAGLIDEGMLAKIKDDVSKRYSTHYSFLE